MGIGGYLGFEWGLGWVVEVGVVKVGVVKVGVLGGANVGGVTH
jgi:hypothetical protein